MGERVFYQWDLLDPARRERYEGAARRNGLKLSKWLREVADAAAERQPLPAPPVDLVPVPELEAPSVEAHVHVPRRTPWGGQQCAECLLLL